MIELPFGLRELGSRLWHRSVAVAAMTIFVAGCTTVPTRPPAAEPVPTDWKAVQRELDHFLCYRPDHDSEGFKKNPAVELVDQFWKDGTPKPQARVKKRLYLCNPVTKSRDGEKVDKQHPDAHLVCYALKFENENAVKATVTISNQFEENVTRKIDKPFALCVPSGKSKDLDKDPGIPNEKDLDHFQCYGLTSDPADKPIGKQVTLDDQFFHGDVVVQQRQFLCNPVDKTVQSHDAPPPVKRHHSDAHLVCYSIDRKPKDEDTLNTPKVRIHNQFEDDKITTPSLAFLCVPSTKKKDS